MDSKDRQFMKLAIEAAQEALERDEVPIGACVVGPDSDVLSTAGNRSISDCDPTGHAEVIALRKAAKKLGNYRLTGCTVYTTIEPCVMCAGALVNARIEKLIYGAPDERFGAVRTQFRLCDDSSLNHQIEIISGVLLEECRELLQEFFRAKRNAAGG